MGGIIWWEPRGAAGYSSTKDVPTVLVQVVLYYQHREVSSYIFEPYSMFGSPGQSTGR